LIPYLRVRLTAKADREILWPLLTRGRRAE